MSCEKTIQEIELKEYISEVVTIYPDYMVDTTRFIYKEDQIIKTITRADYNYDFTGNDDLDEIIWDTCFFNYDAKNLVESYSKHFSRLNLSTNLIESTNDDVEFVREGNILSINFKQGSFVYEIEDNNVTKVYNTGYSDTTFVISTGYNYSYNENNNVMSFHRDSLTNFTFYGFDNFKNPLREINDLLTFPFYTRSENYNSNNPSYSVRTYTSPDKTYTSIDSTIYEYEYFENKISLIRCVISSKSESEDNQTYKRRTMAEFKIKYELK